MPEALSSGRREADIAALSRERVLLSVRVYGFAAFYEASGASARNRGQRPPGRLQSPPHGFLLYGRFYAKARPFCARQQTYFLLLPQMLAGQISVPVDIRRNAGKESSPMNMRTFGIIFAVVDTLEIEMKNP
jgi:hypothetical protein